MDAQSTWGWNLEEMRNAAAIDPQQAAQACPYTMASGFTPVNPPGANGKTKQFINDDGASTLKIEGKAKASKRRKTQTSATPKPRKAAGTKNSKETKTAGQPQYQDITKGLYLTKSAPSGNDAPLVKTVASSELRISQPRHVTNSVNDIWADVEYHGGIRSADVVSRLSGLAHKYELAYAKQGDADVLSKPAIIERGTHSSTRHTLPNNINDDLGDFLVPMSARGEERVDKDVTRPTKGGLIPSEIVTEKAFDSDEIFGDQDEANDFPMNDEGLEVFMQSITPTEVHDKDALPEWQPQHFDDVSLVVEGPQENSQSDGPIQALSHPRSESKTARLPMNQDDVDCFDDDELDEELAVVLSDHNTPRLPGYQSEADYANEPIYENNDEDEEYYQGRFVLSDGPIPAASHFSIHPSSRILSHVSENVTKLGTDHAQGHVTEGEDDCFGDNELDEVLVDLTADSSDSLQAQTPLTSPEKPPSSPKLQWMPSKAYVPTQASPIPVSSIDVPHDVSINVEALPFVRPLFPKPIRDRSPILGLTNRTVLRTCFRIGEALNAAAAASRANIDAIVELYARVVSSERGATGRFKQTFQFGDLFTDKPPYLNGTYSLWKGVDLWDVDSKPFLGEKEKGKMARVIGRIKRCEHGSGCEMVVLSIWEVDWEDVEVAKGIACS